MLAAALLILLAGGAQAQRQAAAVHIVRPGETLGLIAQNYGVDIYTLASLNGISNAHVIHSWQELTIPADAAPRSTDVTARGSHIVRQGESLGSIAKLYGIAMADLIALNNVYGWVYPGDEIALPAPGRAPSPEPPTTDSASPKPSSGLTHIVSHGETLGFIAGTYGVSLDALQALNSLPSWLIYAGQTLQIPAGGRRPEVRNVEPAPPVQTAPDPLRSSQNPAPDPSIASVESSGIKHTVRLGESLSKIAAAYGVSLTELQTLNNTWASIIHAGHELEIPAGGKRHEARNVEPAPPVQTAPDRLPSSQNPAPAQNPSTHTVQRGETLFRIAKRYDMTVDSLMSINGIADPTRIHAGNLLRLSQATASAPPAAANNNESPAPAPVAAAAPVQPGNRQHYVVKRGDFLTQLGLDLNTSWIALAKLNNLADPNNLHVGATLLLPNREDVERYDPEYAAWRWFDMIGNQPGARVGVGREIVIVLGTQSAYAYENGVLQKAARVSAGKKATPTIQGDHEVWLKRRSQTMSGPGYSLDNVEWVMYFYLDYAIHGAWWHMNFGQPMSHGCVNLTNADAQWFYNFASIGTPVHVRA